MGNTIWRTHHALLALCLLTGILSYSRGPLVQQIAADEKCQKSNKDLNGLWLKAGAFTRGEMIDLSANEVVFEISEKRVVTYNRGKLAKSVSETKFVIDPTQNPPHLDIYTISPSDPDKPAIRKAIYEIKGDQLRYVLYRRTDERPTKLDLPADDPNLPEVYYYKRVDSVKPK